MKAQSIKQTKRKHQLSLDWFRARWFQLPLHQKSDLTLNRLKWIEHFDKLPQVIYEAQTELKYRAAVLQKCHKVCSCPVCNRINQTVDGPKVSTSYWFRCWFKWKSLPWLTLKTHVERTIERKTMISISNVLNSHVPAHKQALEAYLPIKAPTLPMRLKRQLSGG